MGKPCVVGCSALSVDPAGHVASLGGAAIREGDWLSLDGDAGTIHFGRAAICAERPEAELCEIERWRAAAQPVAAAS